MDFSITLNMDPVDVANVSNAGQSISIVKPVTCTLGISLRAASGTSTPLSGFVTWLCMYPEPTITVSWNDTSPYFDTYYFYATKGFPQVGDMVEVDFKSDQYLEDGSTYTFDDQNDFYPVQRPYIPNAFAVWNEQRDSNYSFGLVQSGYVESAQFGGRQAEFPGPINVEPVLSGEIAVFEPQRQVCVFLDTYPISGYVLSRIPLISCWVDLTQQTSQSLSFDGANSQFVVIPPTR